ncbi:MAG: nucleotidyltransferase family protein [Alphaproteobacteria bacterium]
MQAIILAGGFGTRLKSVTGDVPKPMAMVAGRPFLCWLLEYMAGQGVIKAVLSLHHKADEIHTYFGHRFAGIDLLYSIESKPLGTGGAIRLAMEKLNPKDPVFVLNGDSLVQLNYQSMMQHHIKLRRLATLATFEVVDCSRYSQLHTRSGIVCQYDTLGQAEAGLISAGFYVLSPDVFAGHALKESFSFEREFLHPQTPVILPAYYDGVGYFIDIGVPHDYARAQTEIPEMQKVRRLA